METEALYFDNRYLRGTFNGYEIIGIINKDHVHTIKLGALVPTSMLDYIHRSLPTYIYDVRNSESGIEFLSNGLEFDLDDANRYFKDLCTSFFEESIPCVEPIIEKYEDKLIDYWKFLIVAGIQVVILIIWAFLTFDMQLGKFLREQNESIYIVHTSYASSALMPIGIFFSTFYVADKLKVFNRYDIRTKWKGSFISILMSAVMAIIAAIMFINVQAQALQMGLSIFMNPIEAYKLLENAGLSEVVNINLTATICGWLLFYIPLIFISIKESRKQNY